MTSAITLLSILIILTVLFFIVLWIVLGICLLISIDPHGTAKRYQRFLIIIFWPLVIPVGIILWVKEFTR